MLRSILVFDVNETLLDLSPLDPLFEDLFGHVDARPEWFASLLHWSTVTTLTGQYADFSALADACLDAQARARGQRLADEDRQRVFSKIAALPAHAEVHDALARLRSAGFTLVALTNSAQATVDDQLARAGLAPLFARVLSVDHARHYKPHPRAYSMAAGAMGCDPSAMRLIAAHHWDVTGALRAGLRAAYVDRQGTGLNPAGDVPDIIGGDLHEVAIRIIERERD